MPADMAELVEAFAVSNGNLLTVVHFRVTALFRVEQILYFPDLFLYKSVWRGPAEMQSAPHARLVQGAV